jgi:hypothetical protein
MPATVARSTSAWARAAAASGIGCVATNGMSQYSRAEFNANAGLVIGVTPDDYPGDALAGVSFQQSWETQRGVSFPDLRQCWILTNPGWT